MKSDCFCHPEFAVTKSVLQGTKDSDKWVAIGRNLEEVTSSSYSSGISYCSIMKALAWNTDYSRADLWHLALKLLFLKLQVQQRGVWIGVLYQKNVENSSVKLFKHDIILWNFSFSVTALGSLFMSKWRNYIYIHSCCILAWNSTVLFFPFYLSEMYPEFFFSLIK